ncbi:MAG TPA: hypothetical protein VKA00_06810 [Trueperaceae bacterium]|nr:hypothetical protein [Trueperaceae bacterium]
MKATHPLTRPLPLTDLPPEVTGEDREIAALAALARAELPVASVVVVPAAVEERFYRLNNLPHRLNEVFATVDPRDPDEDDVEEAAPAAEALIARHYLLDEFIDDFYAATRPLPSMLRVRRPEQEGEPAARGRESLLALKRAYQRDWSFDAVWGRLEGRGAIALEARPVLLHGADDGDAPASLVERAAAALGREVALRVTGSGRIAGVRLR